MSDKPIYWIGTSKEDIAKFPQNARRKAGFQLRAVQRGDSPIDFKTMSIIGKGVEEIRINVGEAYRIFYVARFAEAVYVLHAFDKTTQKTSKKDIAIGKQRYQVAVEFRKKFEEN
jgi:phage-related protein